MFWNGMDAAQEERVNLSVEEMAEAIHMACKALRHGFDSSHPDYDRIPNKQLLEKEVGHVMAAFDLLMSAGDVDGKAVEKSRQEKHAQVKKFLHHQKS